MCVVGTRQIDDATRAQNDFTWKVATHQQAEGLGVSIENPKGSLLQRQPDLLRHSELWMILSQAGIIIDRKVARCMLFIQESRILDDL